MAQTDLRKAMRIFGKNLFSTLILVTVLAVLIVPLVPVRAFSGTYTRMQSITITDTSGVARASLPVILAGIVGGTYVTSGYINANGTNTAMTDNVTLADTSYMMDTVQSTILVPNLPAYGSQSYNLLMGTSSNQTSFPIILGAGGYFTVADTAALELSSNFTMSWNGELDASVGTGGILVNKPDAVVVANDAVNQVTANITGGQIILGGFDNALNPAATEYNAVMGGTTWSASENATYEVMPTAGIFKNLYIGLSSNVTAGANSYIFTFMKNGVAQTLTATITGGNASGSDTTNLVSVVAGDYISLRSTFGGGPGTPTARWSLTFIPFVTGETIFLGNINAAAGATEYTQPQGVGANVNEARTQTPMPTGGNMRSLYLKQSAAAGAGSYTYTLRKAAGATLLAVIINNPATTGNNTANSIALVAGDLIDLRATPAGGAVASPYVGFGMVFTPTNGGEAVITGGSANNPSTASTSYLMLAGTGNGAWNTTETNQLDINQPSLIKNLYVKLSTAPGGGTSYVFSVRDSSGGGGDSGLTVTIAGASTTGNDVVNIFTTVLNATTDIRSVPTGPPAETYANWGLVSVSRQAVVSVSVTAITSGSQVATLNGNSNYPQWATGSVLHFDGTATSNVNAGTIYNASAKLWVSFWFKLDANFSAGSGQQILFGKWITDNDVIYLYLATASGRLTLVQTVGGVSHSALYAKDAGGGAISSWTAGTWYQVVFSLSNVNGHRLRVNGWTASLDFDGSAAPNGGDFVMGNYYDGWGFGGLEGDIMNVVVGTDDLTPAEEVSLASGTVPGDETDYWYIDEGIATTTYSYGLSHNSGTLDTGTAWQTSTYTSGNTGRLSDVSLQVGSARYGKNLKGVAVPDNSNNLQFMSSATPYMNSISLTVGGNPKLLYQPQVMVTGTTLSNRQIVGSYDGTIVWGTNAGLTITYGSVILAPNVRTDDASGVTDLSAYLVGEVTSMGSNTYLNAGFQYGQDTTYGFGSTPVQQFTSIGTFSHQVTGLIPNTTYHFRAFIVFGAGTYVYGSDKSFTTQPVGGSTTTLTISSAKMFNNYITSGDLLLTVEAINNYTYLYPNENARAHFVIQLIATDNTTILGAAPLSNWGDRPSSIYFNPTVVTANITQGSAYFVRMIGDYVSGYASTSYTLIPISSNSTDWKGADLTNLDAWAIGTAINMGLNDAANQNYYITETTDRGKVINDTGGGYFTTGIPSIGAIRPKLFATAKYTATMNVGTTNNIWGNSPTAWQSFVGATIANDVTIIGVPFGITGKELLTGVIMLTMIGCAMVVVAGTGGLGALGATLIAIPILWLGAYFRIIDMAIIGIIVIFFALIAIRQFIIKTL